MNTLSDYLSNDLPSLLSALQGSDVSDMEISGGPITVRVRRSMVPAPLLDGGTDEELVVPASLLPHVVEVTAPLVGTFYRAAHPGAAPLVTEGSEVQEGSVVGIIEALQVLTEVLAKCSGRVQDVLATDGQPVQYGQVLFTVLLDD